MRYITPMNEVHLGAFDLNLLVALDALLVEGSVTKAAARIGVTHSAASHALSRVRKLTSDELLVRGRDGMVPTIRAEAMRAPLRRALDELAGTLSSPRAFDPQNARVRVFIGTSDYSELVLLPGVMARLVREAPGVELRLLAVGQHPTSELAMGKLDFVIMPAQAADDRQGVRARQLFSDRFVCVARRDHPLAGKKTLSMSAFARAAHALVAPWGMEGGYVDDALARHGLQRRVSIAVPHFLVAPHIVASSDLLLTMAERVAEIVAKPLGLAVLSPPRELELAGFTNSLLWHERTHEDPARRWIRDVIVAEAAQRSRNTTAAATRSRTPPGPKAKPRRTIA
jgi:DNA-binding transcriptional LysR family regulator